MKLEIKTEEEIVLKGVSLFKYAMGFDDKDLEISRELLRKKKWQPVDENIEFLEELLCYTLPYKAELLIKERIKVLKGERE